MRFIKGFAEFWYDFIIGDDWKIAAAVVAALTVGAIAVAATASSVVAPLIAVLVFVAYAIGLVVDLRAATRHRSWRRRPRGIRGPVPGRDRTRGGRA